MLMSHLARSVHTQHPVNFSKAGFSTHRLTWTYAKEIDIGSEEQTNRIGLDTEKVLAK